MTFFDRLRRSSSLRLLWVVAAIIVMQSSLACAFDEPASARTCEIESRTDGVSAASVPGTTSSAANDRCLLQCLSCVHCGCHGVAAMVRTEGTSLRFIAIFDTEILPDTAVPEAWTPPTPLRPPIDAA